MRSITSRGIRSERQTAFARKSRILLQVSISLGFSVQMPDETRAISREQKDAVNALVAQMGQHARSGEFVAVMALANAALPDGDPRKITREDVDLLRLLLRAFAPDDKVRDWLPALTEKLAAFLPPEG